MSFHLTLEEGEFLVRLARKAVRQQLTTGEKIRVPEDISKKLSTPCGVFVTINSMTGDQKRLRGCIGLPYPTTPLAQAVIESAIDSATRDPRFHPLSLSELKDVVFEVSVLTPPQIVGVDKATEYPSTISVGKDGLIVEKGTFKGLLLPQVPVEWKWDEEEFLCQCCLKAGLPPDCWLLEGTKIYKFSCVIAHEVTPSGPVEMIDMREG